MIEASNILKFDTPCALERFGKVISTFTEEQNEVLYLNFVIYSNIGGDDSKVLIVLWNKKEIKWFIKWLYKHGGFDNKEVDDMKGLYANIKVLIARVESPNKFLYDMMSMDKAWENNDVVIPNVGLDNNLYENIVETIVRSVRNELENFKNQIKAEMTENMKLRHMIAMDDIRNPKKVKLKSIEGDDDGLNQLEASEKIFRYSKVDVCQVDVNEEVFQTPQNSFPKWWEYSCFGKVQKGYIKGSLNVLCKYKYSVSRRENCGEQNG
ncbi:hypothetical protein WN943_022818 [Citrus x changshan-huyou]